MATRGRFCAEEAPGDGPYADASPSSGRQAWDDTACSFEVTVVPRREASRHVDASFDATIGPRREAKWATASSWRCGWPRRR